MAVCIARVAAKGVDLTSREALDEIADAFLDWRANGASDSGKQTSNVLVNTAWESAEYGALPEATSTELDIAMKVMLEGLAPEE